MFDGIFDAIEEWMRELLTGMIHSNLDRMFTDAVPVYTGNDFAYYAFTKAETHLEYKNFVDICIKKSYYNTGVMAEYGDQLLTLSTCEYSHKNGRMVVVGKLIREDD